MTGFKIRTRDASINYGPMPNIDTKRLIAVYIRQSKKDADDKNGESRKTQLELKNYAMVLSGEKGAGVREYDEGSGISGQKRIDQREKLNQLYSDMEAGLVSAVIVSREDRLFRDKYGIQSGTFMALAEKRKVVVIVPALSINSKPRYYDFSNYEHIKTFKDKMQTAYDYVETHIKYMNANQKNKCARGNYDGRGLPPGFMVPYGQEKMEQKIDVYQPWAEIMEKLYGRWEAYDYSIPLLVRYVEKLPYLFPNIPEDDTKRFCFKTYLNKVSGGYKPKSPDTLKQWFKNVTYIGWWLISQESGEVIVNNHVSIFDKERFEKGYIQLTGHTLEGIPVDLTYPLKRHQARKDKEQPPQAILQFVLSSPAAPWVSVSTMSNRYKDEVREESYYKGDIKVEGDIYHDNVFFIKCEDLDKIVIERLQHLSEVDKLLAPRIETSLENVRTQQVKECVSIDDQLKQIETKITKLKSRLTIVESLVDDEEENEALTTLVNKIQELRSQKRELEEKKRGLNDIQGHEEVRQFYTVIGDIEKEWPTLKIEQKQKLIKLLTTKVEIIPCSMHWYKLTIHWIGPVCNRPDVAYIWRMRPTTQEALNDYEKDLIREYYPTCTMQDLLEKMQNRTWQTIAKFASEAGIKRQARPTRRIIPDNVAWEDIVFFPDKEKAIAMAKEAGAACQKLHLPLYAKWLIEIHMNHNINDVSASLVCSAESFLSA